MQVDRGILKSGLRQTTLAFSTGIFGLDAQLRELWVRYFVEELGLFGRKDLPLVSELSKVIDNSDAIAGKSLSSLVVSHDTNSVAKDLLLSIEVDVDEFLVELDDDILSRVLGDQVNSELTLVDRWNPPMVSSSPWYSKLIQ